MKRIFLVAIPLVSFLTYVECSTRLATEPKKRIVAGYFASWFGDQELANIEKNALKITHLIIPVVLTQLSYQKNSKSFVGTGLHFQNFVEIKRLISNFKQKGIKVLLSIGYDEGDQKSFKNWQPLAQEADQNIDSTNYTKALRDLIDDLGIDGVEIPYDLAAGFGFEIWTNGKLETRDDRGRNILKAARNAVGKNKLVSLKVSSKGKIENFLFDRIRTEKGPKIDFIIIESYFKANESLDVFYEIDRWASTTEKYDPVKYYQEYRNKVNNTLGKEVPISIGLEVPPEYDKKNLVLINESSKGCENGTVGGQPYSVERFATAVKASQNQQDGIAIWHLNKSDTTSCAKNISPKLAVDKALGIWK